MYEDRVVIDVSSNRVRYHLEIKSKVTVIVGDSGVGKTVFSNAINNSEGYTIKLRGGKFDIVSIGGRLWYNLLEGLVKSEKRYIFVFDDEDSVRTREFSKLLQEDTKNLYIIIDRFTSLGSISLSADNIYTLKTNGRDHWLEKTDRVSY